MHSKQFQSVLNNTPIFRPVFVAQKDWVAFDGLEVSKGDFLEYTSNGTFVHLETGIPCRYPVSAVKFYEYVEVR